MSAAQEGAGGPELWAISLLLPCPACHPSDDVAAVPAMRLSGVDWDGAACALAYLCMDCGALGVLALLPEGVDGPAV